MSTPAVYTFKGQPDLHLTLPCDGYPKGAAKAIPDLVDLVDRYRAGEEIDFASIELPGAETGDLQQIEHWNNRGAYCYRYEIVTIEGRLIVTAFEHQPEISEDLQARYDAAHKILVEVEAEMKAANRAPSYSEFFRGNTKDLGRIDKF